MHLQDSQIAFMRDLGDFGVRYLMIGARAMQAHGFERKTVDLDLLTDRSEDSARALQLVIARATGQAIDQIDLRRLMKYNVKVELAKFIPVDILTSIDGIDFDGAYARRVEMEIAGIAASVMSITDLIAAKKVSATSGNDVQAQTKDLADIALMRK